MQIQNGTRLWVVGRDGLSPMTFDSLQHAVKGGLNMQEAKVFTDEEEAQKAERARKRRSHIDQFSTEDVLRATRLALLDEEGKIVQEVSWQGTQ